MSNSWFDKVLEGIGVDDGFFDDMINYFDFPLEDVEVPDDVGGGSSGDGGGDGGRSSGDGGVVKDFNLPVDVVEDKNGIHTRGVDGDGGEEWDSCNFQNLEPPPANVLDSLASGFCGDLFGDTLVNNLTVSCDGSSQLNQWSSTTKASSSRSTTPNGDSADVKGLTWFQSSSPVSVLESSGSCSAPKPAAINPNLSFLAKRDRSKRKRASTFNLQFKLPFISSASSTSTGSTALVGSESASESNLSEKSAKKRVKKKNSTWLSSSSVINKSPSQQPVRKCTHCEITKTPQWREGPKGPKTLCNACGVRYRSGRLFPEYRPAASPTFVPSLHSNSHKKVVEMRKKARLPTSVTPSMVPFPSEMSFKYQLH